MSVTWKIEPTPPVTGAVTVVQFTLHHPDGKPAEGAKLHLEAHMSHPGMAPVTANVTERGNGAYEARVHLTMAGDWVFVVTGGLPDGARITRQIAIAAAGPSG